MKAGIAELGSEQKADIAELRAEQRADNRVLNDKMDRVLEVLVLHGANLQGVIQAPLLPGASSPQN